MAYTNFIKHLIQSLVSFFQSEIIHANSEMKLLYDDIRNLKSFLDASDPPPKSEEEIIDVISEVRDLIISFISDGSEILTQELRKARQDISSLTEKLQIARENSREYKLQSNFDPDSGGKINIKLVGLDKELPELQDWVCSQAPTLDVMFVVGMAGIGKTTLVKQVYYDPVVIHRFEKCLYLPIGPQCRLIDISLLALDQLGFRFDEEVSEEGSLAVYVYKSLYESLRYHKYLIVLDDIWDTQIWDELKLFFPNCDKGSRIILTSRLLDLIIPPPGRISNQRSIQIPFLNDNESWNLLREKVFTTNEFCHPQVEKIGRKIAKKCEGLPLAIIQVGELLRKTNKTVEEWEVIAENEDPLIINSDDNTPLSNALYLSYKMLPQYLKVCFLYMGVFPKGYEIRRSKLISLWVSEGFFKPREWKSLEQVALVCLKELVSQSVVLNEELRSIDIRATKTCRLHFTFRSLCVSEAKREKIFPIIKKYDYRLPDDMDGQQRLCIHNNVIFSIKQVRSWMESVPSARSLLCFGPKQQYPVTLCLGFRLLEVLEALAIRFYEFPHQVLELVHLKYLTITYDGKLPPLISRLSNLQVLIIHPHHNIKIPNIPVYLPIEIWNLLELKHLQCRGFDLPEPPVDDALVLRKLLTLSAVSTRSCTSTVFARMPNLQSLGIQLESAQETLELFLGDFASLYRKLESFKCVVASTNLTPGVVPSILRFPVNIQKITLSGCGFLWEDLRAIATLPNLVVLKLRWYAFTGPEWSTLGRDFLKLKFLLLEDLDIQNWEVGDEDFPVLKRLIVRHCYKLKRFSSHIGLIASLELIEVYDCSSSLAISALEIQDEQLENGNKYFQVRLHSSWEDKKSRSFHL